MNQRGQFFMTQRGQFLMALDTPDRSVAGDACWSGVKSKSRWP
jgi:hypothetical protein